LQIAYITIVTRNDRDVEFQLRLTTEGDIGEIWIGGKEICSFDWDGNMRELFNKALQ